MSADFRREFRWVRCGLSRFGGLFRSQCRSTNRTS